MAVYTDVNENELSAFLKAYPVGELLSYKGIAEGTENSNFLVHASTGSYILTLYEKRVDKADLPFFLGLMGHLARKGISCPLPVTAHDGTVIGTLAGRPAVIITFLEGLSLRRPTAAHCGEVGRALAALHLAGQDFPMKRPNALAIDGWRKLWAASRDRADEVEPGLAAEVDADFLDFGRNWPTRLPQGIIHADLFPDNVFFLGEKLSGLIDFYFACDDLYAYDVATCLNAWCFEKDFSFNLTKGAALLAGYQSVRPLEGEEKAALPMLARGSALRFMLTRLYDWLTVPNGGLVMKRDPTEYIRRMRFHRAIMSPSEYGLT
ncbi:homoserine kinase [Mesorhizobium sp.]|uniref:homoserine kinase n=1 Tax=Mesorhizobium sp. TaxID=1871066 RepID=UPI000FE7297B|nr:homoserine kinase [Mesorhizobium sp.]RWG00167.1 MAG: homoserine kinase [Mesorhizobium sp.]RWH01632.1 MAG: homoserine kinase [Mesorhizobium sp.]TIR95351.1 MAG: homoserine kinase [Mesorhizobium sp.]